MSHRILRPSFVRDDERGSFRELINIGQWESLVQGDMRKDAVLGNHYHKETQLFFMVLAGRVRVETEHVQSGERECFHLEAFEGVIIHPYESHKMTFEDDGSFLFLKQKQYDPNHPDTYHHAIE